ncbi:hypothetical protein GWO43_05515 [candidate division KSB1 bacterium]|nr:hypothetical protein [candidate division KSB1 bacterium]NIR71608.1 hypothetical protein [candidate division KSB1 bacterium]NIS23443.1 hypothetical protein [candidate division KSB1 bacterium]NIT70351.1 hypothetical protein [candidate division KSB1 bacterium]NIU24053.1 hypothetical protein [candidate division KSB1 bacterium]
MGERKFKQSDYMSLQLMEIESFRMALSHQSEENVSFQDAVVLWIAQGYADEFRTQYMKNKGEAEPATA